MTTPPSDPYSTPPSGQGDNQQPQQPPPFPGQSESTPGYSAAPPPYQAPAEGTPGYPAAPYGEAPPAVPDPPRSILTAVKLMFVGAGLQALTIVFGLTGANQLREQLAEQQPDLTADELDGAVALGIGVVVVIGLIAVGLWIWMAFANRRGRSWARIVATVLGALNIAFTLFGLSQSTGLSTIFQLITIALAAAIIFLLFRPESTAYYNAVSNQPRMYG
jgi:hypothetical protein